MKLEVGGLCPLIQVFDMATALAFYRDALGFEVVMSDGDEPNAAPCNWAMLRLHDSELMLNTAYEADERPAAPDPARIAAHADTTFYFGCDDVDAAYAYLRERGVEMKEPKMSHYGMKQLYLKDPDGYELCFQQPGE
jgi:glyoxylase I family protein